MCARNLPIHPLATNTLRVHTLGELLARCGMFWRADVSLRSHTHTHAPAPAAVHPAALTAPPPGATRTTAVRSRPHVASTCAISIVISTQADDWDSVTMVKVIPAGVAGTDGFFLQ